MSRVKKLLNELWWPEPEPDEPPPRWVDKLLYPAVMLSAGLFVMVALIGVAVAVLVLPVALLSGKPGEALGALVVAPILIAIGTWGWRHWCAIHRHPLWWWRSKDAPVRGARRIAACAEVRTALVGVGVTLFGILLAFFIRDVMITGTVDAAARCRTVWCLDAVEGAHTRTVWEAVGLIIIGASLGAAIGAGRRGKREGPEDKKVEPV